MRSDIPGAIACNESAVVSSPGDHRRLPGEPGIWILIFGDLLVFGLFFVTFAAYRLQQPELFARSHLTLSQGLGLLNTIMLLTSSWFVVLGMNAVRAGESGAARKLWFPLAITLGLAFLAVKFVEYHAKLGAGIGPNTNDFYMLYFTFTGVHALHVVAGIGALIFMFARAAGKTHTISDMEAMESCGVFWHLVDILWVVLFAIFYLHR